MRKLVLGLVVAGVAGSAAVDHGDAAAFATAPAVAAAVDVGAAVDALAVAVVAVVATAAVPRVSGGRSEPVSSSWGVARCSVAEMKEGESYSFFFSLRLLLLEKIPACSERCLAPFRKGLLQEGYKTGVAHSLGEGIALAEASGPWVSFGGPSPPHSAASSCHGQEGPLAVEQAAPTLRDE